MSRFPLVPFTATLGILRMAKGAVWCVCCAVSCHALPPFVHSFFAVFQCQDLSSINGLFPNGCMHCIYRFHFAEHGRTCARVRKSPCLSPCFPYSSLCRLSRVQWILVIWPFLTLLCQIRNIKYVAPFSGSNYHSMHYPRLLHHF